MGEYANIYAKYLIIIIIIIIIIRPVVPVTIPRQGLLLGLLKQRNTSPAQILRTHQSPLSR